MAMIDRNAISNLAPVQSFTLLLTLKKAGSDQTAARRNRKAAHAR